MNRHFNPYLQGEWVFAVCNAFDTDPVYAFSLGIKGFQLALGYEHWRYQHVIRVKDGIVTEMVAEGCTHPTLAEWLGRKDRTVAVFRPLVPFGEVEELPYAFFDIPQIALHHFRKRLGFGHAWNGVDGVPKKRAGNFCSEEMARAIGRRDAHIILPAQCWELPELEYVATWPTFKDAFAKYYQPA